jgi:hypothetical protein
MNVTPRRMPVQQLLVAIGLLIVGGLGTIGATVLAVPDWQAAHGGGVSGTFTLTQPLSCDRYQPPRQRCGWLGDFRSDDGTVTRRGAELSGGLPPGAQAGQILRARNTGSLAQVYREGDTQGWKTSALFVAGFLAAFLLGFLLLEPWRWRSRLRQTRERRS